MATARYQYGLGNRLVAQHNANGAAWQLHTDQLGTIRAITDPTGAILATVTYDPYGNLGASHWWRQTDGTRSLELFTRPRFVEVEPGRWEQVDLSLTPVEGGFGATVGRWPAVLPAAADGAAIVDAGVGRFVVRHKAAPTVKSAIEGHPARSRCDKGPDRCPHRHRHLHFIRW